MTLLMTFLAACLANLGALRLIRQHPSGFPLSLRRCILTPTPACFIMVDLGWQRKLAFTRVLLSSFA
jgi:hypothetical protein